MRTYAAKTREPRPRSSGTGGELHNRGTAC